VGGFSKGMRQKLALIRCLLHEPEVIFLDEPSAGLDPESARVVRDAIVSLKQQGRTIFLCTHNMDEAERLCDNIAIVNRRVLHSGSPGSLKHSLYGRKLVIRLEQVEPSVCRAVSGLAAVEAVEKKDDRIILQVSDPEKHSPDIINAIVRAGGRIRSVGELRHSMEDVYIKLIGDRYEL